MIDIQNLESHNESDSESDRRFIQRPFPRQASPTKNPQQRQSLFGPKYKKRDSTLFDSQSVAVLAGAQVNIFGVPQKRASSLIKTSQIGQRQMSSVSGGFQSNTSSRLHNQSVATAGFYHSLGEAGPTSIEHYLIKPQPEEKPVVPLSGVKLVRG